MSRNKTYYQQHPCGTDVGLRPTTLTVAALRSALDDLDGDLPVIFRSPLNGCFGPRTGYAVDTVARETLEAQTIHNPATTWFDEEEGVEVPQEAYDDELPAWDGVVIS